MQMRRLDPLANAGPYQRIARSPVKSFSITEAQFDRVRERRPELVLIEGESAVVGRPYRDYLEVHYGFADAESFADRFAGMFEKVVAASSKEEAPRGLLLMFRDRPNRMVADTVFWPLALDQGQQRVEMNLVSVPEQPEPGGDLGGASLRAATEADHDAIADLDAAATGAPRLTAAGVQSLAENTKALRIVESAGKAVGFVSLRTEPGGWGIIEDLVLAPETGDDRGRLLEWCIAWLRNNGGRRARMRAWIDDSPTLALLRAAGFTPGETGLDYTRTVDLAEAKAKIAARQAHGTVIKFGDWR